MKIGLVCSHGGHMLEIRELAAAWQDADTFWVTYDQVATESMERTYTMRNIGLNPYRLVAGAIRTWGALRRERPDVIISTGAEIAIPAFYLAKLMGIRTIFIEVWTRVSRPTMTGRIVYPVCDQFFVQWPEMLEHYGSRAQYSGSIL